MIDSLFCYSDLVRRETTRSLNKYSVKAPHLDSSTTRKITASVKRAFESLHPLCHQRSLQSLERSIDEKIYGDDSGDRKYSSQEDSNAIKTVKCGYSMASQCVLCKDNEEDDNHLFFTCSYSIHIWNKIRSAFKDESWDLTTPSAALGSWKAKGKSVNGDLVWPLLFHAGVWMIWKQRNDRLFADQARNEERLIIDIISLV